MSEKIRVLIVDDLPETRENVRKLLQFETDVEVVAQAGDGTQAVAVAQQHQPDVILMDINMPGQDGISASQAITRAVPSAQIIIMSVQSEADYLRRAMLAGARDFLMKPFSGDELMAAIRRVYETRPKIAPITTREEGRSSERNVNVKTGKIISVFSPKGGSGCTTIAINMAVSLATRNYKTALVDASLQFGDVAVTLNVRPTTSIIDLVDRISELDGDFVSSVLVEHSSGLKVLLAPPKPEQAEHVKAEHVDMLLKQLAGMFDYVIVDTSSALNEITLAVLDASDRFFLVAQQSLASLTNMRRFFDVALDQLEYDSDKILLLVNKSSDKLGISVKDVSDALKRPVVAVIPSDEIAVTNAADRGQPLALNSRGRRDILVNAFSKLVDELESVFEEESDRSLEVAQNGVGESKKKKSSFLGNLFGR